ncbi:GGDEF domain-containing protein [Cupriavidus sp. H19C3]
MRILPRPRPRPRAQSFPSPIVRPSDMRSRVAPDLSQRFSRKLSIEAKLFGRYDRVIVYAVLIGLVLSGALLLFRLEAEARELLLGPDGDATARLASITRQFHVYIVGTFLTGLFMLHHVRARFRLEARLVHQADHDPLTGLPNRRSFDAAIHAVRHADYSVVLASIDRFERVATELGLATADQLIALCAERIAHAAQRHRGRAFRLDGVKLGMLFTGKDAHQDLAAAIFTLQAAMTDPFMLNRREIFLNLSIGSAEAPADATSPGELLRNAGTALQAAQAFGGDTHLRYSPDLQSIRSEKLWMEAALNHAVERGEMSLYYQPQQRLRDGRLSGFEALLRWHHDGRSISPSDFIPLAEESGQIIALGDWVLREACTQARAWRQKYRCPIIVAINISPRQFQHPAFLARVRKIIEETGVSPSDIELEITEGMMIERADKVIALLNELRGLGLRIAIDDFGTGYSSLSYLTRLPIDRLKIDRAFIQGIAHDPRNASVVQAAISLGHNLGLSVLAEGVESAAQREWLAALSCDEIQGFVYGRPVPASAAESFLRHRC